MRLLLIEDDRRLANLLLKGLREHAYAVDYVATGTEALTLAALNTYDGVVLDVGLPDMNGFEVCVALRRRDDATPVLMLTARDEVHDRVHGLDVGADDYLTKPFDFSELLARLRAIQRRGPVLRATEMVIDDLVVNATTHRVTRAGEPVELTAKEFALLEFMARRAGAVLTRAEITGHVWDDNHDPASNTLEVYISRLRRKVDRPGVEPLIHTRRGAGYVLGRSAEP